MSKEPEYPKASDIELEARREEAEGLKLEARRDGVKDVEREARIEELESAGDLVEKVLSKDPVGKKSGFGDLHTRDRKITPAKTEKGWYSKSPKAQQIELEKISGTYRYRPGDPYAAPRTPGRDNRIRRPGTLKDYHESEKVRRRNTEADALLIPIKAPDPAPKPAQAPPPVVGYCHYCHGPIPPDMRIDSKFCGGRHRTAFFRREEQREKANKAFKDHQQGKYAGRMLSIHHLAADAMRESAARCGIDATFVATTDGVLAVHSVPLPRIEPKVWVQLVAGDGYALHHAGINAADAGAGTLFTFEMPCQPEGAAEAIWLRFEGDPGKQPPSTPVSTALPPMSGSYAARNHRVAEYLMDRKSALVTANPG